MCLAVPLKLKSVAGKGAVGKVETSAGSELEVNLELVPGVEAGEWVLVHAGMAIERLPEARARENLEVIKEVLQASDELSQ